MADLFRVLFIIVPHTLMIFSIVIVFHTYARALRLDRLAAKASGRPVYGLLPKHVLLISLTVITLSVTAVVDTVVRMDTPLTFRFFGYAVAGFAGVFSMYELLRFERTRYAHVHTDTP